MPGKFRSKSGATLAGHSDKWSDENRSASSHEAGQGSNGSRNQGTGIQGKVNAMPSQGIDTSRMDKSEKLKYFNSLGLLQPEQKQELSIKTWPDTLRKVFKDEPVYIKDITAALKSVPQANYPQAIQAGFNATQETMNQTDDVYDIYAAIMQAIQG
ncbi:putative structural protein [Erwinia phage pEa_SNUABM_50]|uniref:Putative structural protein n=1 Tax=Erwinia phage pEa_SNUABM_50 TaxID=2768775 RepID=A0A7L8ZPV2_9CAUD|nr:putative structural protein [Erwinia phage pEa_SNUABM_50]